MTLVRQVQTHSLEGTDLTRLDLRVRALELSGNAAAGNGFTKRLGKLSKLASHLKNLHDRVVALEASSTSKVDFETRTLARRMPLGKTLYDLNARVAALE
jgi:hypothetical protein